MLESRKKIFENFKNDDMKKSCIDGETKIISKDIKVGDRIGSASVYGEVYKACHPLSCKYKIAIKMIPLSKKEISFLPSGNNKNAITLKKHIQSEKVLNNSLVFSELFFLKLTNFLVKKNINPHLPLVYKYFICDECKFSNKNLPSSSQCIIVANELAEGDLKNFLTVVKPSIKDLFTSYFQIFTAIYAIQKYFNIYHNDLHWGNVLYHKKTNNTNKTHIKYIINGKSFVVKNTDYLMVLWDFGLSIIPGKIDSKGKASGMEWYTDYEKTIEMLEVDSHQKKQSYARLGDFLKDILYSSESPEQFLSKLYDYIHEKGIKSENIAGVYNMDKKVKTNDEYIKKYLSKAHLTS